LEPIPNEENQGFPFHETPEPIPALVLTFLLFSLIAGALFGSLAGMGIASLAGYDLQGFISSFSETGSLGDRNLVRSITMANHLFTFLIPGFFVAWYFYKKDWFSFLKIESLPGFNNLINAGLFIMVAFPLAQLTYWLNSQIPLPEMMSNMEDSTEGLIKGLLVMNGPSELVFNLVIIALLPALAEEIIFRGIVQTTLEKWLGNPVKAVWIAAFIFSFIHFQFEGFLPRMVLGALLGYLFYWTRNLWIPIFAHFINNGVQVLAAYWYPEQLEALEPESMDASIWISGLVSLVLTLALAWYIKKQNMVGKIS
jgi:membrane protease YdiL (CAAX protease family)